MWCFYFTLQGWNWNLSCELKIKIKHEFDYHWNKKFGLKLNQLHSFIQISLSFACVGFIIIWVLDWVHMLMGPNWAKNAHHVLMIQMWDWVSFST
jgi:hypothetical protein